MAQYDITATLTVDTAGYGTPSQANVVAALTEAGRQAGTTVRNVRDITIGRAVNAVSLSDLTDAERQAAEDAVRRLRG